MISTGVDGPARLERLALEVAHGAHPAAGLAGDDRVADVQRAAVDEHGGHDAAARVDPRLDDVAAGRSVGVGLEVADLGDQQEHVEEVVEADALLGAGLDEDGVAAPLLGDEAVLGELLLDAVSMLASGLSILLTTMTMGTPAALAWSMASTVCGMTPSSAATTMTAMSVTLAPRARMAVKAAWPGVSRKVMSWPLCFTW